MATDNNTNNQVINDEDSVFSEDPKMYEILGIEKRHRTMASTWDLERIVAYQINKDIDKIKDKTGSYKEKVVAFYDKRGDDVNLKNIGSVRKLGRLANFQEVSAAAAETSWRATTQPHGEVAERHYQEWLASRPKGPTVEQIKAMKQKEMDYALWDKILHGRDEPPKYYTADTRSDVNKLEDRMSAKEKEDFDNSHMDAKQWNIMKGNYELNRPQITELDLEKYNIPWKKGVYIDHDMVAEGFLTKELRYEGVTGETNITADTRRIVVEKFYTDNWAKKNIEKFIGQDGELLRLYKKHCVAINLEKVDKYLKDIAAKRKEEAKLARREARRLKIEQQMALASFMESKSIHSDNNNNNNDNNDNHNDNNDNHNDNNNDNDNDNNADNTDQNMIDGSNNPDNNANSSKLFGSEGPITLVDPSLFVSFVTSKKSPFVKLQRWNKLKKSLKKMMMMLLPWKRYAPINPDDDEDDEDEEEDANKNANYTANNTANNNDNNVNSNDNDNVNNSDKVTIDVNGDPNGDSTKNDNANTNDDKHFNINDLNINNYNITPTDFDHILKESTTPSPKKKKKNDDDDLFDDLDKDDGIVMTEKQKKKALEKKAKDKLRKKKEEKRKRREELARIKAEMDGEESKEQQKELTFLEKILSKVTAFKEMVFGKPETVEAKRRRLQEEERQKEILRQEALVKEKADNVVLMKSLFSIRERQRDMDAWKQDFLSNYLGIGDGAASDEYFNEVHLITAAKNGNFGRLIDVIDSDRVKIDAPDQDEGVTALWASLAALINETRTKPPIEVDIPNIDDFQGIHIRIKNKIVRFITERKMLMQMDLVIRILLYKGANINFVKKERDGDGLSVLHLAAQKPSIDMVTFILNRGANINCRTSIEKMTPLMVAIQGDHLDIVLVLLREGAMLTINSVCRKGWSALHYGACFGSADLVMALLLCGADTIIRNKSGNSSLEEAIARGRTGVIEILRTFKAVTDDYKSKMEFFGIHYIGQEQYNSNENYHKKKKVVDDDNDDDN